MEEPPASVEAWAAYFCPEEVIAFFRQDRSNFTVNTASIQRPVSEPSSRGFRVNRAGRRSTWRGWSRGSVASASTSETRVTTSDDLPPRDPLIRPAQAFCHMKSRAQVPGGGGEGGAHLVTLGASFSVFLVL